MSIEPVLGDFGPVVDQIRDEAVQHIEHESEEDAEAARRSSLLGAMVEAAYLVAAADGGVSDEECEAIASTFSAATGEAVEADTLGVYVNDAASMLEGEGADARFAQVADLITDDDQRRAALLVASVVAWRDGGVGTKQGLALQKLARTFDVELNELHKIMAKAKQQFG